MSQPAPTPDLEPNVTVPEDSLSTEEVMMGLLDDIPDPDPEPESEPESEPDPEPESEPDPEPDDEPEPEAEPDDEESPQINTLADMAKAYDLSENELAEHLTVPGPDGAVPLADVLKAFRDAPNAVAISEAVTAKTKELDSQIYANKQLHDAKLIETQTALERLLAESRAEEEPNWKQLEENDPQEYARQHIRWTRRQDSMRLAHQNLLEAASERDTAAEKQQEEWAAGEVKVLEDHPDMVDWVGDQALASRELNGMNDYLITRGFKADDPDLAMMRDHRVVLIVRDAMRHSGLNGQRKVGAKKLRVATKGVIQPQARADDLDSAQQRRGTSLKRHEATGTVESAAAAFLDMEDL